MLTLRKEKKQINKRKKKKKFLLPPTQKTLHFLSFLLLCSAIMHVKDIKVKRKFYYIIPRREFFTT